MAEKKKPLEAAAPASDKKKALETAMAQIEKAYGKGAIMRLGANPNVKVESIPTGPGSGPGHRRRAPRPDHRNLRPGVLR